MSQIPFLNDTLHRVQDGKEFREALTKVNGYGILAIRFKELRKMTISVKHGAVAHGLTPQLCADDHREIIFSTG